MTTRAAARPSAGATMPIAAGLKAGTKAVGAKGAGAGVLRRVTIKEGATWTAAAIRARAADEAAWGDAVRLRIRMGAWAAETIAAGTAACVAARLLTIRAAREAWIRAATGEGGAGLRPTWATTKAAAWAAVRIKAVAAAGDGVRLPTIKADPIGAEAPAAIWAGGRAATKAAA